MTPEGRSFQAEKQRTSFIRSPRSGKHADGGGHEKHPRIAREKSNPITIARLNAVETVKLHERPPLGGSLRAEQVRSLPRAKHVRTGAIGIATTLNDVEEWYLVYETTNGLELRITRRRDTPTVDDRGE